MVHVKNCEETTDCISRSELLKALDTWDKFGCNGQGFLIPIRNNEPFVPYIHYHDAVNCIKNMPSIYPRTGHWIKPKGKIKPFGDDTVQCDMCGFFTDVDCYYNFCPNCGCMMIEEGEHDS